MLEVAQMAVIDCEAKLKPQNLVNDYEGLSEAAEALKYGALRLASALSKKSFKRASDICGYSPHLAKPIYQMFCRYPEPVNVAKPSNSISSRNLADAEIRAWDMAREIWAAVEHGERLSAYANKMRTDIAGDIRNPGTPVKNAFAERIMEGWIFLTESKPSERNNTFKSALETAWQSIFEETSEAENWTNAVRSANRKLSNIDIDRLSTSGPFWI